MPNNDGNISKRTSQYIDNLSFDENLMLKMIEITGSPDGINVYRAQVDSTGALKTSATVTATSTPTYKDDPTNTGETPKYGKTNSVTHKQQVEVEISSLVYPASTGNNTVVQLAAGGVFTGAIETILNLQAAQVQVVCDQPYTVNINQYIDAAGTKITSTDTFSRTAGQPLNENITLPGNYFNLTVTNTGAATTTTFRVDTTFGIMATSPRANTNLGNFKVAVQEALPTGSNTIGTVLITNQDITVKYKIADQDEISAIIHYYSFLEPSGKWYILRQDATNALTTGTAYRYTNGASGYATGWTNRATPTIAYTYLSNLTGL